MQKYHTEKILRYKTHAHDTFTDSIHYVFLLQHGHTHRRTVTDTIDHPIHSSATIAVGNDVT